MDVWQHLTDDGNLPALEEAVPDLEEEAVVMEEVD